MLKYFSILLLTGLAFSQVQKASFVKQVEVDANKYVIWHGYVIDSLWWNVWLPDGNLPRRANGTYLYWKEDTNGNLIPLRKIDYRLPILRDEAIIVNKEKNVFN